MKMVFAAAALVLAAQGAFAQTGFEEGPVTTPRREVLNCRASYLVQGQGAVQTQSKQIDVSAPNTADVQTVELLRVNDIKVYFQTYDAGVSVYFSTGNKPGVGDLAHASTSLGPIRDGRNHKLYMLYEIPGTKNSIQAACNYSEYVQ